MKPKDDFPEWRSRVVSPYFISDRNDAMEKKYKYLNIGLKSYLVRHQNDNKKAANDDRKPRKRREARVVSPYFEKNGDKGVKVPEAMAISVETKRKKRKKSDQHDDAPPPRVVSPYFVADSRKEVEIAGKKRRKKNIDRKDDVAGSRVVSPYFTTNRNDTQEKKKKPEKDGREEVELGEKKEEHLKLVDVLSRFAYKPMKEKTTVERAEKGRKLGLVGVGEKKMSKIVVRRKKIEKSKVLNAAEKRDEAYKRKTDDNKWNPPPSEIRLIQQDHLHDPWRVLVICMLLNRTTGAQATRVISDFFSLCPNAKAATEVSPEEIVKIIHTLGLHKRAQMIQRFSREYLEESWTHVTQLHGVGNLIVSHIRYEPATKTQNCKENKSSSMNISRKSRRNMILQRKPR
ncbi:methyl-CpG-binding domain protein 4-like protein isoform X1 [Morus notabilis]|uniref:methyl-CpG-binding domain protein 4-like protein isoform X1 n=1 Tax=Morus notabilis TaxID=981085 RepID=UPI000CED3433|nr:methyl-CpG-binding domain protein 4-like protein isoform X1 [Morus notabilis]